MSCSPYVLSREGFSGFCRHGKRIVVVFVLLCCGGTSSKKEGFIIVIGIVVVVLLLLWLVVGCGAAHTIHSFLHH